MPQDRKDRREKMAKEAKTNAMRMLDRQKVKYEAFSYECDEFIDGIHSADKIGAPYDQSFKTLVMEGKSGGYFVFVVPIEKEVDRKAAAKAVGEKTVDMIHVKDITKITGYVRGGCSPLGMSVGFAVLGMLIQFAINKPVSDEEDEETVDEESTEQIYRRNQELRQDQSSYRSQDRDMEESIYARGQKGQARNDGKRS